MTDLTPVLALTILILFALATLFALCLPDSDKDNSDD